MGVVKGRRVVYTPLGAGRIVYLMPDGSLVVEFEWGSGHIFRPEELLLRVTDGRSIRVDGDGKAGEGQD